jgi:hypothetical protein
MSENRDALERAKCLKQVVTLFIAAMVMVGIIAIVTVLAGSPHT